MVIAKTRLETLQACKLLQCVRRRDLVQIERLVANGVPGLLDYNDPAAASPADENDRATKAARQRADPEVSQSSDADGDTALTWATSENDIELVDFLLRHGADPDATDLRGRTAVFRAAERGYVECMQRLLRVGANLKVTDVNGKGVLFYCLTPSESHMQCIRLALSHGAEINALCRSNTATGAISVLQAACVDAVHNEPLCLLLLDYDADPNSLGEKEGITKTRTALMTACASGGHRVVRALLEHEARVNDAVERTGYRALHEAAKAGHVMIIQMLVACGAQVNVVDNRGNTPMHLAAANGHAACCKFLAQRGCNPKLKNRDGLTARLLAKQNRHKLAVKECRRAEAIFGTPKDSVTPAWAVALYDFCYHRREQLKSAFEAIDGDQTGRIDRQFVFEVLQQLKAPLPEDPSDLSRLAAVHEVREKGPGISFAEFISGKKYVGKKYLMSNFEKKKKKKKKKKKRRRRDKGRKGRRTRIPIAVCVRREGPRAEDGGPPAEFVVRQTAATDERRFDYYSDESGDGSSSSSDDDEEDMNVFAKPPRHYLEDDSWWYMPPDHVDYMRLNDAVRHADLRTLQGMLIDRGRGAVDQRDRFYKTPLMIAAAEGNLEVVQFLVNNGADVNASDNFKWTPLHFACRSGQIQVIELLLAAGASMNAVTFGGATPLMRAVESGRPEVVHLLLERGADMLPANRKGKTVMDLAITYGDQRVYSIVKEKWKSLPPSKTDGKKSGRSEKRRR